MIEGFLDAVRARHGTPSAVYRAPARVNLIGEHTDYNDGLVLPTTTALDTLVAVSSRDDGRFHVFAEAFREEVQFELSELAPREPLHWSSYVKGVVWALARQDAAPAGANLYVAGDIPLGRGLSSSASLTVAAAMALDPTSRRSPLELAQLARLAETEYAGLNCGIMDQLAIAACPHGSAIRIDCGTLDWHPVAIPEQAALLLIDSGVRHQNPEGGYNDRTAECRQVAEVCGIASLRELDAARVAALGAHSATLQRRAKHVLSENERVDALVACLERNDLTGAGAEINSSHQSLAHDYEVSCAPVDALQRLAREHPDVYGARMVGGGFGGCVLALTRRRDAAATAKALAEQFAESSGAAEQPWTHVTSPCEPAGRVR